MTSRTAINELMADAEALLNSVSVSPKAEPSPARPQRTWSQEDNDLTSTDCDVPVEGFDEVMQLRQEVKTLKAQLADMKLHANDTFYSSRDIYDDPTDTHVEMPRIGKPAKHVLEELKETKVRNFILS